jgi:hypothetical protein
MREPHLQYSDEEFRKKFELLELPPEVITHEAHFRIVWVYLKALDFDTSLQKVVEGIKKFDQKFGRGAKYHATISYDYMQIFGKKMEHQPYLDWAEFIFENEDMLKPVKDVLLKYYKEETLFSERAKREFLEPDLNPF